MFFFCTRSFPYSQTFRLLSGQAMGASRPETLHCWEIQTLAQKCRFLYQRQHLFQLTQSKSIRAFPEREL